MRVGLQTLGDEEPVVAAPNGRRRDPALAVQAGDPVALLVAAIGEQEVARLAGDFQMLFAAEMSVQVRVGPQAAALVPHVFGIVD